MTEERSKALLVINAYLTIEMKQRGWLFDQLRRRGMTEPGAKRIGGETKQGAIAGNDKVALNIKVLKFKVISPVH